MIRVGRLRSINKAINTNYDNLSFFHLASKGLQGDPWRSGPINARKQVEDNRYTQKAVTQGVPQERTDKTKV